MNYKLTAEIMDIIMPLSRRTGVSPMKLITESIIAQYKKEDNVCQKRKK